MSRAEEVTIRSRLAIIGLAGAFFALALIAKLDPDIAIDRDIARVVQRTDVLDGLWRAVSWPGESPWNLVLPLAAIGGVFFVSRRDALGLAVAVLGVTVIGQVTRLVVDRPRPGDEILHEKAGLLSSFPSGHVTLYVAMFGFLAIVARDRIRARGVRVAVVAVLVAAIVLVGPSRVYLGWHWPIDVAGSYALAGAWLSIAARTRSASQV